MRARMTVDKSITMNYVLDGHALEVSMKDGGVTMLVFTAAEIERLATQCEQAATQLRAELYRRAQEDVTT